MLGELFGVLSHPLRRRVLYNLYRADPTVTLDIPGEISVAGWDETRIETELTHVHLPKLADENLIRWDRADREIRRGPDFDKIEPLLSLLDEHADELPYEWP